MFNPIRCYGCGKVLPYSKYDNLVREGHKSGDAFAILRLARICCISHILARPPENDEILMYPNAGKRYLDLR